MKADYDDRDAPPDVPAPSVDEAIKAAIERVVRKNWGPGYENWKFEEPQPPDVPADTRMSLKGDPRYAITPDAVPPAGQFDRRNQLPRPPAEEQMSLRGVRLTPEQYRRVTAPNVPKPPAFIAVGGGMVARRDAIVAAYEAIGLPGTVVLFASGQSIAGPRPHAEFVKELLEGA